MFFSENLKNFRRAFKINQQTLANMLGLSRSQVANYEQETSEPTLSRATEIAKLFEVPLDVLCRDNRFSTKKNTGALMFNSASFNQLKASMDLQYLPYVFGAFRFEEPLHGVVENWSGDSEPREFLFLGSIKHEVFQYLLTKSLSYQEFERFIQIIYLQTGWQYIDKAGTKTFLIVKHPDDNNAYYHIYGNFMSGAKVQKVYGDDVINELDHYLNLDAEERVAYLEKVYDC